MTPENLMDLAREAMTHAYVPYSGYKVGAALLCADGTVYQGCNIENASYSPTICAERTAFFKAVSEGSRKFQAIAIAGGLEEKPVTDYAWPCGICRQVMQEFCGPEFQIIVAKSETEYQVKTLAELLPHGFGGDSIA